MKAVSYLSFLVLLLLTSPLLAQKDSLPKLVKGRFDWTPYQNLAPKRMNQKDYAIYMVRMNGLEQWFETEPNQDWIQDFHFFDVNKNLFPDAVYSGPTEYFKGDQTLLMFGDSSFKYPLAFSAPGYIHNFVTTTEGIEMSLVEEPAGDEFRVHIRHFFYDYAADSARQLWQLQYLSTTQVPEFFQAHEAFSLRETTYLRTSPELRNDPPIDYDGDEKPDGLGNVVSQALAGQTLFRVHRADYAGESWSFVLLLDPPGGKSLFQVTAAPINAYAGWIPSAAIED